MLLVDTNHWVFYLDDRLPENRVVGPALEAMLRDEPLLMTAVVQLEVAHYAARELSKHLEEVLERFFGLPTGRYEALEPSGVMGALGLMSRHRGRIGSRDAHLLYAAKKHHASLLLTDDKGLTKAARAEGLTVRNLARR